MQMQAKRLKEHPCFQHTLYLQSDPTTATFHLNECLLLRPSPQFPPYAVASVCELFEELSYHPHPTIEHILKCEQGQHPYVILQSNAGENLTQVIDWVTQQGWSHLPLQITALIIQQLLQALSHIHALGFVHGGLLPQHIYFSYSDALLGNGGVRLTGFLEGSLHQLSRAGEHYGRGSEADCRAVLMLFMDLMQGQVDAQWQAHQTKQQQLTTLTDAQHVEAPHLFQWCQHHLQSTSSVSAALLSQQLNQLLSQLPQKIFDEAALGRWLGRVSGHRKVDWQSLVQGDVNALERLFPQNQSVSWPTPELALTQPATQASISTPVTSHVIPQQPLETTSQEATEVSTTTPVQKKKKTKKKKSSPMIDALSDDASFFERVDYKLDYWEQQIRNKIHKKTSKETLKVRVAILWNDTIESETYYNLNRPLSIGTDKANQIPFPAPIEGQDSYVLVTPSNDGMLLHVPQDANGWFKTDHESHKQHWDQVQDRKMSTIPVGGSGLIQLGSFAIWIQLTYISAPSSRLQFSLPIPRGEAVFLWSFSFAILFHLTLLVLSFSAKNYDVIQKSMIVSPRFIEVLVTVEETKIEEAPEEKPEEEVVEELTDDVSEDVDTTPDPTPRLQDEIKQRATSRFGKGKKAVDALAAFLNGTDSSNDRVSLGDAMSALQDASGSGGLGSVFGSEDGNIDLGGGGGGGLDTSGGSAAGQRATRLKGKRVARRPKGKVKSLKSRVRTTGGSLSREAVLKVIGKHMGRISACYENALIKKSQLSGKMTAQWMITPSGSVSGVKEKRSSLGYPPLTKCVFKVIKRMKFPKPKGGSVKISYPFVFQRG